MKIFNTLSRSLEEFLPIKKGHVSLYTCGPTVYHRAHIGNLRTYIFEDLLRRVLEYNGYRVKHVMNITDVGHLTSDGDTGDDRVEHRARTEKKAVKDITKFYTDLFIDDLKALNVELPIKFAWASKYIKEQIDLIKKLEEKGYTYVTADGVYFDTGKYQDYGKLGRHDGGYSRIEHDLSKKSSTDFALWKFSRPNEKRQQEWESPWGLGFPGWHLECSAISSSELGQPFDIHTGGEDHIAVHHNNEIAQSEAAYSKPLAHYWMHGAFLLNREGQKMAKSAGKGNFYTLDKLAGLGFEPLAFRYLVITSHYREPLNFSIPAMEYAQNSLDKLRRFIYETHGGGKISKEYKDKFQLAINYSLHMPNALTVLWDLVKTLDISPEDKKATIIDFDKVLGLGLADYSPDEIPMEIIKLVLQRKKIKDLKEKNWSTLADKVRKKINKLGFDVNDTLTGPKVTKRRETNNQ